MAVFIFVLISVMSAIFGLTLIVKPVLCIEMQKRFYRFVNWNIEPVSIVKEIRNTRIMGVTLLLVVIVISAYIRFCGFPQCCIIVCA